VVVTAGGTMDGQRSILEQFYDRFGEGDLPAALAMFAASVQITDPGLGTLTGLEAVSSYLAGLKAWVPDARAVVERVFEVNDTVIVEGRFTGTSAGTLSGPGEDCPSLNAEIDLAFADFARVRDERIVEYRTYYDQVSLLTQLGQMG
jgi:ketosteroid isomerase-like protein